MATWNNSGIVVTDQGQAMLSAAQIGAETLTITKVLIGAGRVADNLLTQQTAVSTQKQQAVILNKRTDASGNSVIDIQVSNTGLAASYEVNQIAIYASTPSLTERLYMLAQCVDGSADVMPLPSVTPTVLNYSFYLIHEEGLTVEASVNLAGLVTMELFNALVARVEDLEAMVNQGVKNTDSPTFVKVSGAQFD